MVAEFERPACGICRNILHGPRQTLECSHQFCPLCVHDHVMEKVQNKQVLGLSCPLPECNVELSSMIVSTILLPGREFDE